MVTLDEFRAYAKSAPWFNDIEFWPTTDTKRVTELVGREVEGLVGFAEHGSGSLYALLGERVVWLDSEGEQFVLAASVHDLVSALHCYAGGLYDVAAACNHEGASLKALQTQFGTAWRKRSMAYARERFEGHEAFVAWAASQGAGEPVELVDKVFALRDATRSLRARCVG